MRLIKRKIESLYLLRSALSIKMSRKRGHSASPPQDDCIFRSSPITDRSSKFVGFFSPSLSSKKLQSLSEVASASHRTAAWRTVSSQRALSSQRLFDVGHDDDGEKYGGKTLEKILSSTDVEGSVVVARWYGGVMLGPVRFDHIRNCAQEAIASWTLERDRTNKRQKIKDENESRQRLARVLPERDESITVLRGLLAEKKNSPSSEVKTNSSPARVPVYSNMSLAALEKLEQVRDKTIAWILKEIEKVELSQEKSKIESEDRDAGQGADSVVQKSDNADEEESGRAKKHQKFQIPKLPPERD